MVIKIGIIAFKDVEELDLVGPWEVFQGAQFIDSDFECEILSFDGEGVDAAKGMYFGVHGSMRAEACYDILLLPGGKGSLALMQDEAFLACLMAMTKNALWVTSVCTGSLVYGQMGLLEGRDCTTYHACYDALQEMNSLGRVLRGRRYVRDGKYVTAAGVSAGIDMALWLLGEIKGAAFARQVQQHIEYFPEPPYADVVNESVSDTCKING